MQDIEKRLAEANEAGSADSSTSGLKPVISLDAPRVPFAGPGSAAETTQVEATTTVSRDLDSKSVKEELEALRSKLAERRKIRDLEPSVEKAREGVVNCLRENDRRPLDCWQEVDTFKREVAKMERSWVEKIVS